jgi:hypothetical protein
VAPARITAWLGFRDRVGFGLVDGLIRLTAFVLYLLLISQWKEMARVLGYHGAEHKAIHALESGAPLTPESVQSFPRLHPRCGTTFLFLVVVISIVAFTFIGRPRHIGDHLLRIAALPLIAGVAFEFIRLSGKYYGRAWVRALVWPGMQFQRLTTRAGSHHVRGGDAWAQSLGRGRSRLGGSTRRRSDREWPSSSEPRRARHVGSTEERGRTTRTTRLLGSGVVATRGSDLSRARQPNPRSARWRATAGSSTARGRRAAVAPAMRARRRAPVRAGNAAREPRAGAAEVAGAPRSRR